MASHNLKTVIGFEFFRVLKKKRFWVTTLAIPAALAVVFGLVFISGQSSSSTSDAQKNTRLTFQYSDASGLVTDTLAGTFGGTFGAWVEGILPDDRASTLEVAGKAVASFFWNGKKLLRRMRRAKTPA